MSASKKMSKSERRAASDADDVANAAAAAAAASALEATAAARRREPTEAELEAAAKALAKAGRTADWIARKAAAAEQKRDRMIALSRKGSTGGGKGKWAGV